ncbi:MAG: flagellar assembly protein FliW [Pirellulales bacterium]
MYNGKQHGDRQAMEIGTTRFGTIQISVADRVCFPAGLPGFEDCRDWVLLVERPDAKVGWLQSADWSEVALPVGSPRKFVPDYDIRIEPHDLRPLGLESPKDLQIVAILGQLSGDLTMNLKAPVAINMRRRLGRQVVHVDDWSIHQVVLQRTAQLRKIA